MKIILNERIDKLGAAGEVVTVKDGFARNYLIPRGLALGATRANLRRIEMIRREALKREAKELEEYRHIREILLDQSVSIPARFGEKGRLYGSITDRMVLEAVSEKYNLEIDRRHLRMEPLKRAGEHEVRFRFHPEVDFNIKVLVTDEDGNVPLFEKEEEEETGPETAAESPAAGSEPVEAAPESAPEEESEPTA